MGSGKENLYIRVTDSQSTLSPKINVCHPHSLNPT